MLLEDKPERRRSPRLLLQHEALLRADMSLLDATARSEQSYAPLNFMGQTCDISAEGLGLVITHVVIDERFLTLKDRNLNLILDLPGGSVNIEAKPVRLVRLDEQNPHRGYLIGAQITHVDESRQYCFSEYLRKA